MKTSWTQGVDKELAVDIRQNFKESLVMRRRFEEMLNAKMVSSQRSGRSKEAYENPNWAYLQADARGYERALQDVIELLSDKSTDKQVKNLV